MRTVCFLRGHFGCENWTAGSVERRQSCPILGSFIVYVCTVLRKSDSDCSHTLMAVSCVSVRAHCTGILLSCWISKNFQQGDFLSDMELQQFVVSVKAINSSQVT